MQSGQGRRRDPLFGRVARDIGESFDIPILPVISGRDDVLVAAADEVPPHHQILAERLAADQREVCAVRAAERKFGALGAQVQQRARTDLGARDGDLALDHQHRIFEAGFERKGGLGARLDPHVRADEGV